jgi:hypothetical protein
MQPSERPLHSSATARTFPPHRIVTASPPPRAIGRFSLEQYRALLGGMVAKGHGIEALCLFLTLTRDALLDLVVQFDLPTPHDLPLRRPGGAQWKQRDFEILLDGWHNSWSAAYIGDRLGRSRGSVWYQARRLGLPKRERRLLHWPEQKAVEPLAKKAGSKQRYPARWFVKGTDRVTELRSKRNGLEVDWANSLEAYIDIGWRHWARQRTSRIAEDYGVSYRTITSQIWWLQPSPPKDSENLREEFDRAFGEANARAAGAVLAKCQTNNAFPYWKTKYKRLSRRDKRNGICSGMN